MRLQRPIAILNPETPAQVGTLALAGEEIPLLPSQRPDFTSHDFGASHREFDAVLVLHRQLRNRFFVEVQSPGGLQRQT